MRGILQPLAVASSLQLAAGHGAMMMPPSWFQKDGYPCTSPTPHTDWANGQMWYTNYTFIDKEGHGGDGEATIGEKSPLRTWGDASWATPGGNARGCVHADGTKAPGCAVGGNPNGRDAVDVHAAKGFKGEFTTEWRVGSVVETPWPSLSMK
eukprot:gene3339-4629_t